LRRHLGTFLSIARSVYILAILLPNKKVGGIRSKKGRIVDMKIKKGGRYGV